MPAHVHAAVRARVLCSRGCADPLLPAMYVMAATLRLSHVGDKAGQTHQACVGNEFIGSLRCQTRLHVKDGKDAVVHAYLVVSHC